MTYANKCYETVKNTIKYTLVLIPSLRTIPLHRLQAILRPWYNSEGVGEISTSWTAGLLQLFDPGDIGSSVLEVTGVLRCEAREGGDG